MNVAPVQQRLHASARLPIGALARFAGGLDWRSILDERGRYSAGWWRHAVVDAESRGLLVWSRLTKRWRLTPAGRALVRGVS